MTVNIKNAYFQAVRASTGLHGSPYICICNIKNADFQAARVPTGLHGSPRVPTGPHGSRKKRVFFLFSPLGNAFLRAKYTPEIGIFELPIRGRGLFQIVAGIIFCPTRYVYVYICYCHSESDVLVCKRKSQKQSPWSPPVATTKICCT